jgi:DNA-binding NarL/FixJ family response regulator
MIRVDILDSCPVFMVGLERILTANGFTVVGARDEPDIKPEFPPDVSLIDPTVVGEQHTGEYVGGLTARALLLVDVVGQPWTGLLSPDVLGVVSRRDKTRTILDAIRSVAAGIPWSRPAAPDDDAKNAAGSAPAGPLLSEREEQVIRHISRGLTHGQVARRLGISPHTVDTYVRRIRSKLGVGNKAELTRAALLGGLTGR